MYKCSFKSDSKVDRLLAKLRCSFRNVWNSANISSWDFVLVPVWGASVAILINYLSFICHMRNLTTRFFFKCHFLFAAN